MEERLVLLSGEHPTLPAAELRALLHVHDPGASVDVNGLVARVATKSPTNCDAALRRMALAHEVAVPWATARDTPEGIDDLVAAMRNRADGRGSFAVETERRGALKSMSSVLLQKRLGAALGAAGHAIDLRKPDRVLSVWLVGGNAIVGERVAVLDRGAFESRQSEHRAHFSPVGLHPRRARSLLHLARIASSGTIYDPFCGTGGFLLEAALEGHHVIGSDMDSFMVQGSLQTLADAGPEPLAGDAFVADIADAPRLVGNVDGIVTDLPYGRASGTAGEPPSQLYERAFVAFAQLLRPGAYAVVGCAQPELLPDPARHGFRLVESHSERVHKTLTRHYVVLLRNARVAATP